MSKPKLVKPGPPPEPRRHCTPSRVERALRRLLAGYGLDEDLGVKTYWKHYDECHGGGRRITPAQATPAEIKLYAEWEKRPDWTTFIDGLKKLGIKNSYGDHFARIARAAREKE